ncbi:Crp/Fnr family transcriptional regulator [Solimonas marina]|uniref:Crp/Fnr family transcriptional regulator n=1 Tax=Solimonas marina TaxID=2714601 RepID=A0A970BA54_9GAMM|nr:Crp/Fnr family transcriptional regulator [Solimonas marina]NKF23031.1 Crp/Fnr family transcriptional regulator [Solimonas marina]
MSDDIVLKTIEGWQWFAYVPPEARQWLAERASVREIAKGKMIFSPGDAVEAVFGVISGSFRIYLINHRGDEITMEEVVAGGWFSHYAPQPQPRHLLHCVCQHAGRVVVAPHLVLVEFAERWPQYYKGLYDEFTARAIAVFARLELLSLHNTNVRFAVYLLRMARVRGRAEADGSVRIDHDESQSEIGSRIGATRQRVNGVIASWTRRGIIEVSKDCILVRDVATLRSEACKTGFDLDGYLSAWHYGWQGNALQNVSR